MSDRCRIGIEYLQSFRHGHVLRLGILHSSQLQIATRWASDRCQTDVRSVSDLSQLSPQKHKRYIVICLSGVCEVIVTITVISDSYTSSVSDKCQIGVRLHVATADPFQAALDDLSVRELVRVPAR